MFVNISLRDYDTFFSRDKNQKRREERMVMLTYPCFVGG
jgi:hypothetical protein